MMDVVEVSGLCVHRFSLIGRWLKSTVFRFRLILKPLVIFLAVLLVPFVKSSSLVMRASFSERLIIDFWFESAFLVLMLDLHFCFLLLLVFHVLIQSLYNLRA